MKLEVSIFFKSAKMEVKIVRPTKLEKRPLYISSKPPKRQTFIMAFATLWAYLVLNKGAKSELNIFKNRKM